MPAKDLLRAAVQEKTRRFKYLLSGDVKLDIEWWVHEQERYETNRCPDIDNIRKPLLDALSGPDGLLLDDCQIQEVACRRINSYVREQRLLIEIRFHAVNADVLLRILDLIQNQFEARKKLIEVTGDYSLARRVMPTQRVFHRANVQRHRIREIESFRRELSEESGLAV